MRQFGSFDLVIPPRVEDATVKTRLLLRPRELVPIGHVARRLVPVRHPVMAGTQHAIYGARRGHEFGARLGRGDLVDQRVDNGIADPGEVERAIGLRCLRAPIGARVDARREATLLDAKFFDDALSSVGLDPFSLT